MWNNIHPNFLKNFYHLFLYSSSSAITSFPLRTADKVGNEDVSKINICKPSRVLEFTSALNPTFSMVCCQVFATKFSFDLSKPCGSIIIKSPSPSPFKHFRALIIIWNRFSGVGTYVRTSESTTMLNEDNLSPWSRFEEEEEDVLSSVSAPFSSSIRSKNCTFRKSPSKTFSAPSSGAKSNATTLQLPKCVLLRSYSR